MILNALISRAAAKTAIPTQAIVSKYTESQLEYLYYFAGWSGAQLGMAIVLLFSWFFNVKKMRVVWTMLCMSFMTILSIGFIVTPIMQREKEEIEASPKQANLLITKWFKGIIYYTIVVDFVEFGIWLFQFFAEELKELYSAEGQVQESEEQNEPTNPRISSRRQLINLQKQIAQNAQRLREICSPRMKAVLGIAQEL